MRFVIIKKANAICSGGFFMNKNIFIILALIASLSILAIVGIFGCSSSTTGTTNGGNASSVVAGKWALVVTWESTSQSLYLLECTSTSTATTVSTDEGTIAIGTNEAAGTYAYNGTTVTFYISNGTTTFSGTFTNNDTLDGSATDGSGNTSTSAHATRNASSDYNLQGRWYQFQEGVEVYNSIVEFFPINATSGTVTLSSSTGVGETVSGTYTYVNGVMDYIANKGQRNWSSVTASFFDAGTLTGTWSNGPDGTNLSYKAYKL